ncbi:LytR/AlgR family response regulator transcription factor [Halocola ammonii]
MDTDQKLTALIVDDELHARENLKMLLDEFCPSVQVVGMASNVEEARSEIDQKLPQIVFLDIRMPSGTEGFELLDKIEEKQFQVVFVTAFKDYAIRAFNANAIHYLLKPIDIEDLKSAVERAKEYFSIFENSSSEFQHYTRSVKNLAENLLSDKLPKKITLYHSRGFKVIDDTDIVRLKAESNCTNIYFADGSKYLDTKTLRVYEDFLNPVRFVRIHKSHMINLDFLEEYNSQDGNKVILKDGTELPVSRGRLTNFMDRVKNLSR